MVVRNMGASTGSLLCSFRYFFIGVTTMTVLSTSCASVTPHENFMKGLKSAIGTSVDIEPMLSLCSRGRKDIESKTLPNGHIEDRQIMRRGHSECIYYCEVDPQTRVVVSVRVEGNNDNCSIPP